jgi:Domain of unknown function DUF29
MAADYATDFYGWATETARKIRSGRLAEVNLEQVAEEIESLGKSEQQQLSNRLIILLVHMLKWEFQPGRRKSGWQGTILEQRERIKRLLAKNPSLQPLVEETIAEAYSIALTTAAFETHMVEEDFPRTCPYLVDEILPPR